MIARAVALLAIAGCWRSRPAGPDPQRVAKLAPSPLCREVGERWLAVRFADDLPHPDAQMTQDFEVARESFAEQCSHRRWDAELRRCIAASARPWELETCLARLPHADRRIISHREIELFSRLRDLRDR